MNIVDPRIFVDDQFPLKLRPLIPKTLKTAYRAAGDIIKNNPLLSVAVTRGERGRIIQWAVDFGFERLIETGALPFDKSWEYYGGRSGRYLAIRPQHSVITISQVANPDRQPRDVRFRQNARVHNAPFFDFPEFSDENEFTGEPHILITHGYQNLNFSHLCMPENLHHKGYTYRSGNLMNMPHEVELDGPPPEDTDIDFESLELLKEDIERYRRDYGSGE